MKKKSQKEVVEPKTYMVSTMLTLDGPLAIAARDLKSAQQKSRELWMGLYSFTDVHGEFINGELRISAKCSKK